MKKRTPGLRWLSRNNFPSQIPGWGLWVLPSFIGCTFWASVAQAEVQPIELPPPVQTSSQVAEMVELPYVLQEAAIANPGEITNIQSIELENNATQLVVRADGPLIYNTRWDAASRTYLISIPGAMLTGPVSAPFIDYPESPLSWVQLQQEDPPQVTIRFKPANGFSIGAIAQPRENILSLALQQSDRATVVPTSATPVQAANPIPNPTPTRNQRLVVVLDPGHGGSDPGAIGIGGLREKDIVLPITQEVARLLEAQGVQAILTREQDRTLDLAPRTQLANRVDGTVFVSIHANAINMSRPDVNGIETYYYQNGLRLAQTIHSSILQNLEVRDRRVRQARFYVLRNTSMPAVLVEVGFVTGREDAANLSDPAFRNQMAAAIAQGILQYLQNP